MDDDFVETGKLGFQVPPKPRRHDFDRWVLKSFNIIEIRMIELIQEGLHGSGDLRVIINPANIGIDFAFDRDLHFEAVSMHAFAFVIAWEIGQCLGGLEPEIFGELCAHDPSLNALSGGFPYEFVHLKLETRFQLVAKHPADDVLGINLAEHGREQHLAAPPVERVLPDHSSRPLVIFFRANDEFHFVPLGQVRKILHEIACAFAAPRRFEVHDSVDARIDLGNVMSATGLDENLFSSIA